MGDRRLTMDSEKAAAFVAPKFEDPVQMADRVAVLVAGMHRSGTSALTRVLSLLGCSLPQHVMGNNPSNPTGHWEPQTIVDLNDEILEAAGTSWNDWQGLNPGWETSPARAGFLRKARRILEQEYEDSSFFVIKDPRICRIAPFWLDALRENGIDPRIIVPVRNPLEVASSLQTRDGIDTSVGYLIWLRHALDAERGTRGEMRVFTTYSELLGNWSSVTTRIAQSLNFSWPRYSPRVVSEIETFLDSRLRNHKCNDEDILSGTPAPDWVRMVYQVLLKWSASGEDRSDYAALGAISNALDEASSTFGKPMELLQRTVADLADIRGHVVAVERDRDLANDRAASSERNLLQQSTDAERTAKQLAEAQEVVDEIRKAHLAALKRAEEAEVAIREYADETREIASRLADTLTALESARAENSAAIERTQYAEQIVEERSQKAERLAAQLVGIETSLEIVRSERDAALSRADNAEKACKEHLEEVAHLRERLIATEGALQTSCAEHSEALTRAEGAEKAVEAFTEEARIISTRLAATESSLKERDQEAAARASELTAAKARVVILQDELKSAQDSVSIAEKDQARSRMDLEAATARLSETGSELLQRKEELRQVWIELDKETHRSEALETALKRSAVKIADLEREVQNANKRSAAQEAERERQAASRFEKVQKELADVRHALTESNARLEASEAELAKTHAAARAAISQRSQTFNEIAIVTQFLRDTENVVLQRNETVQWLSQIYTIMLRRPRWWIFLSRKAQFKRLGKRVEERGLFDANSYLAKNPDVAASGVDPLRHYITHGIKESRPR